MSDNYFIREGIDAYKSLGVHRDASIEEIKKAYKNIMRENHPDMHLDATQEEKEEHEKTSAFYNRLYNDIFSTEERKRRYDEWYDRIKNENDNFNNKSDFSNNDNSNTTDHVNDDNLNNQNNNTEPETYGIENSENSKKGNELIVNPKKNIGYRVVNQEKTWLQRNWKKVALAAGIATAITAGILVAPYVVQPVMYSLSKLWHVAPALRGVTHGINTVLGFVGNISPFSTMAFDAAAGTWALNGVAFNATVATANGLAVLGAAVADIGGVAVLTVAAKKAYKKIVVSIEKKMNDKDSSRSKDNTTEKTTDKNNNFKDFYEKMKNSRKKKREEKKNSRFINFVDKLKNAKNEKNERKKQDEILNKYKNGVLKIIETIDFSSDELYYNIVNQVNYAMSANEIDAILDFNNEVIEGFKKYYINTYNSDEHLRTNPDVLNTIIESINSCKTIKDIKITVNKYRSVISNLKVNNSNPTSKVTMEEEKEYEKFMEYKNRLIDRLLNLKIKGSMFDQDLEKIKSAKSEGELDEIITNNNGIMSGIKKSYYETLLQYDIDLNLKTELARNIDSCKTYSELRNCIEKCDIIIFDIVKNKKNEEEKSRGKGKAA